MRKVSILVALLFVVSVTIQCSTSPEPEPNDPVGNNGGNGDGNDDGNGNDDGDGNDDGNGNGNGNGNTDLSFGITVGADWFAPADLAFLYISDENGMILAEGALENNMTTTLELPAEAATRFDATILRRLPFNGGFINIMTTYEDVSSDSFTLSRIINPSQDLLIDIQNTGCLLDVVSTTGGGSGSGTSNNGGSYEWDTSVTTGGNYFMLMRCPGTGITRYLWEQDITAPGINVDYQNLPTANLAVNLTLPSNSGNILFIRGNTASDLNQRGHRIELDEDSNGVNFTGLIPAGLFDSFYLNYSVFNGNSSFHGTQIVSSFPSSISTPNFDINLVSTDLDNFEVQTSGTIDAIQARYFYSAPNSPNSISYNIVGPGDNTSFAAKSALVDAIFEADPAINASNLQFSEGIASDFDGASNFSEYVKFHLEFNEQVTSGPYRSENVAKRE